ncbi:amidohydrolase family protein [Rhizobium sp. S163]|uniref:amidohydrolase family protein n=1 Tax=Rhizobium sp. S163 TaxID=3055039 RepID=UPI0025A97F2E|nr:amidohydrolase family protein [Rhizobium sp. S163]MDM9649215.1 amidohydrolase family protein [Rhizobium sp. S163]
MIKQRLDTVIVNGRIVTGDGVTEIETGNVLIGGQAIVDVIAGVIDRPTNAQVIDATGCTILPGIMNGHAHGCAVGPTMPSGSRPFAPSDIEYHLNRHLLSGTTTLLNVCGLALMDEIAMTPNDHPLEVAVSTAHTPANLAAAIAIDGAGLGGRHHKMTIEAMIKAGAKALGEAGGGQTLGGGAQDYRFIPDAIHEATAIRIHPNLARALKEAVVGRKLDHPIADLTAVDHLLQGSVLRSVIDAPALADLVRATVMPPVSLSLQGLVEIAEASSRFGLPAIFHNATPTADTLMSLTVTHPKARMIAAHSNHPSFEPEECVSVARALRSSGVTIDVSTLDCISTRWRNQPTNLDRLVSEGLVDTLSTDFAGGDWDSILEAINRMVRLGQSSLAQAVALATGNVASALPELASDRGLIASGRLADIAIVEGHNLSRVRHVIKKGRVVVCNGAICDRFQRRQQRRSI